MKNGPPSGTYSTRSSGRIPPLLRRKLYYLKSCLKGKAEVLVHSLPTTEENFARAWKSLKDYYENKWLLRPCYANFVSLPKMKDESAVKLKKIFHSVVSTAGCLEGIGRLINSSENLFVLHLTDSTEPPSYDTLLKFLERRVHILESTQFTKTDRNSIISFDGSKNGEFFDV